MNPVFPVGGDFALPALAALPPAFLVAAAAVLGLLVGSFLNVVIHRLPRMMEYDEANYIAELRGDPLPYPDRYDLMVPRSACPHCGHAIAAWENIPVISYLFLRGRCSACKVPIGMRYPLVELASGVLSALAAWHFGATWQGVAALVLLWALLALTMIDADTQLLPDQITLPLVWLGLLLNLGGVFVPLADAVIGAVAGYLLLWSAYWLFKLVRGKEGMGYGDFKLMAALGGAGSAGRPCRRWCCCLRWSAWSLAWLISRCAGRTATRHFRSGPSLLARACWSCSSARPCCRCCSCPERRPGGQRRPSWYRWGHCTHGT